MMQIRRYVELKYLFTGWFHNSSDLRANFTEFNQNGGILQKYCFGNKDFVTHVTKSDLCIAYQWTNSSITLSNYTNQYKHTAEKMIAHKAVHMVNVDISLGQHGACQDVHFSIETT
jgi:hypothetical protein